MASPIPPPLFLSTPGDPPIPWADWKLIFEAYVDAIGDDARKPERRKALYGPSDVFQAAVALFDDHFKDVSCDYVARLRFQERRQLPGEPVVDFIASLRSLAASCGSGALENDMIRQQLFMGVASQNARCRLLQKGSSITLPEAFSIAREDELVRVQLEHNFLLRGHKAPIRSARRANMAALLLLLSWRSTWRPLRIAGSRKPSTWRRHAAEFILSGSASSFGLAFGHQHLRCHDVLLSLGNRCDFARNYSSDSLFFRAGCYFPCSSSSCVCSGCTFRVCTAFKGACIFYMCSALVMWLLRLFLGLCVDAFGLKSTGVAPHSPASLIVANRGAVPAYMATLLNWQANGWPLQAHGCNMVHRRHHSLPLVLLIMPALLTSRQNRIEHAEWAARPPLDDRSRRAGAGFLNLPLPRWSRRAGVGLPRRAAGAQGHSSLPPEHMCRRFQFVDGGAEAPEFDAATLRLLTSSLQVTAPQQRRLRH
ncbi:hypothetical protein HPB52_008341 [Rhipicephalus sanguineus]|uniref:Tick transposon n=1 Tax=Rhipicephalus sanguineus TaxID=34632 RepID=A0A9D4SNW5_RHISA|nr:hypothetical protein HPB52_008341 [Rhipicephalus sanguineus]